MKKDTIAKKEKRRRVILASIAFAIALIMVLPAITLLLTFIFN